MLLDKKVFFVKERLRLLKLTDTFDILDPETNMPIGIAVEKPEPWVKFMRIFTGKFMMPTIVEVSEGEGQPPVFTMRKGFGWLTNTVEIVDAAGVSHGYFKSRVFTIGGRFDLFDVQNNKIAQLKGDFLGWNFKLVDEQGVVLGLVTKKWAGIGKEFFTSADSYTISLENADKNRRELVILLLAAGLAVDIIFKENSRA